MVSDERKPSSKSRKLTSSHKAGVGPSSAKARRTVARKSASKKRTKRSIKKVVPTEQNDRQQRTLSRPEDVHTYMRERIYYADSTPSNSSVGDPEVGPRKSCWDTCILCPRVPYDDSAPVVDYPVSPPGGRRSVYTIDHLKEVHQRLVMNPDEYDGGWKNVIHYEVTNVFKHAHTGLSFLRLVDSFCEKALQSLSYYLEDGIVEHKVQMVDGRSIIGSYMWTMVEIVAGLMREHHFGAIPMESFSKCLIRIVEISAMNWKQSVHLVNLYIKAGKMTMRTLNRYIQVHEMDFSKFPEVSPNASEKSIKHFHKITLKDLEGLLGPRSLRDSLKECEGIWRAKFKQLKLFNNAEPPLLLKSEGASDPLCLEHTNPEPGGNTWTRAERDEIKTQVDTLMGLGKVVEKILKEVRVNLHLAAKYLWSFADDDKQPASSYGEALRFARRSLKSVPHGPRSREMLNSVDRVEIVELGKILQDELDLSDYLILSLRELVLETTRAVRIPYEHVLLMTGGKFPKYQLVACPDPVMLLDTLFKQEDVRKLCGPAMTADVAEALYNTSPYKNVLQVFPLKFNNLQYRLGQCGPPIDSTSSKGS